MRGLTRAEYALLCSVAADGQCDGPDGVDDGVVYDAKTCRALYQRGRMRQYHCDACGDYHAELTPGGRESMRIHDAVQAVASVLGK